MSKQVVMVFMVMSVVTAGVFFSGCTTAQSRRQDKRIEDLERRMAKIEFDSNDSPSSSDDLSRYREMARTAR